MGFGAEGFETAQTQEGARVCANPDCGSTYSTNWIEAESDYMGKPQYFCSEGCKAEAAD